MRLSTRTLRFPEELNYFFFFFFFIWLHLMGRAAYLAGFCDAGRRPEVAGCGQDWIPLLLLRLVCLVFQSKRGTLEVK